MIYVLINVTIHIYIKYDFLRINYQYNLNIDSAMCLNKETMHKEREEMKQRNMAMLKKGWTHRLLQEVYEWDIQELHKRKRLIDPTNQIR